MTSESQGMPFGDAGKQGSQTVKLRPTLFIAIGGTGMEVVLRVRRRILNAMWGDKANPQRVESMEKFHIAEFIHFDLDHGAIVESGRSQKKKLDPLSDLVKLSDEDKIIESFDIEKYSRSDDDLARYPHIAEWSPLTPKKIRELGIDPSKGAGQMRGISRLYFFDKYPKIRDMIRNKLRSLKSSLSKEDDLRKLGLQLDTSKFRIVVVGSVAGGTGAGSFLDMGYLAGAIAKQDVSSHEVDMMMFLPSGYATANKERTQANGYASLMEMETAMRGGNNFVSRWDMHDNMQLSVKPYDEVFLIDSGNLAGQGTENQKDVYEMVADTLFEDFRSADFANRKRSVAVNQSQHKITPFSAPIPQNQFGDMKLNYFKGYSAFGQASLDTQSANIASQGVYRWTKEMLEAFFGVASDDKENNRATDKQRDAFIEEHMHLKRSLFTDFPRFSSPVELPLAGTSFFDYPVTNELLKDSQGSLLANVKQKVDLRLDNIANNFNKDEWPAEIRNEIIGLERDCMKNHENSADTSEDRIEARRIQYRDSIQEALKETLYKYLDNRDLGGLEYTISLIEQVKDKLAASHEGIIKTQQLNAKRYSEIRDAVRTSECDRLLNNLSETRGSSLFGNKEKQARAILNDLKTEIGNYLAFHLRAKAAEQSTLLLQELSRFLGEQKGLDDLGDPVWDGLVGDFQNGRASVQAMLKSISDFEHRLNEDNRKEYVNFIRIDTPLSQVVTPNKETLINWAEEALEDIGGSRELFESLQTLDGQSRIFRCLSKRAQLEYDQVEPDRKDPLVEALIQMDAPVRQKIFSEWMTRAMPWIDANMGREFTPAADQFKCYIGVGRAADYARFKDDILAGIPVSAGVTASQVSFVDSGIEGRAVCYVELSGIPLTVLRGLETWKSSYTKESEKIPVHTKSDVTAFEHPLVPSAEQLKFIAEDFRYFLLAVMTGVLKRDTNPSIRPAGQYQFSVGRGDVRRMGNERSFRLNGLPKVYREKIIDAVCMKLDQLSVEQTAVLATLAESYAGDVYTPLLVDDEKGVQTPVVGFASSVAARTKDFLLETVASKGGRDSDISQIEHLARENFDAWTTVIPQSDQDANAWEVREVERGQSPRLKRVVKPDFFQQGWIETALGLSAPQQQAPAAAASPFGQPPAVPGMATPPPVVQEKPEYWLHINGQNMGPYTRSAVIDYRKNNQVTDDTLCWREGWANWMPVKDVSELQVMVPPPVPGAVPPPVMS